VKTVIEMAREAELIMETDCTTPWMEDHDLTPYIERFAELVRADEREKYKWDVHSCGPNCTKVACVAMREAVKAEREACAKVCDRVVEGKDPDDIHSDSQWAALTLAAEIRARSKT